MTAGHRLSQPHLTLGKLWSLMPHVAFPPTGRESQHPLPVANATATMAPAGPAPATCPGVAAIALAAAGKLAPDQQRAVVEHLGKCNACQKLRNQTVEQLAAWSGRFLYKSHLAWANDWSWLAG